MNWRNPLKELPKQNEVVWVLLEHWKENGALSCEIYAGEVFKTETGQLLVANYDYYGQGSSNWEFPFDEEQFHNCNYIKAWAYITTKDLPEWL